MSDIKKQLQKLDISKLKTVFGNNLAAELKRHAKALTVCIQLELNKVYDSYEPKFYERTYKMHSSLTIGDMRLDVTATDTSLSVSLIFDENAIHRGFDGKPVNTAVLLNEGWNWHNGMNIPYFSNREGTHFIEKGIERYKQKMKNPFAVKLHINNETREF